MKILEGVDRYQVVEALFEGVRVILSYRGESYSPQYIQGISGAAFRIGGICPCAPTCTSAMDTKDLVELLGYESDHILLSNGDPIPDDCMRDFVYKVRAEIDHDRPVLVWHAFTNAEWDVVCGYDEEENVLYGRGSYVGLDEYAKASELRAKEALNICPALG